MNQVISKKVRNDMQRPIGEMYPTLVWKFSAASLQLFYRVELKRKHTCEALLTLPHTHGQISCVLVSDAVLVWETGQPYSTPRASVRDVVQSDESCLCICFCSCVCVFYVVQLGARA